MRQIAIDIETSGIDSNDGHEMIRFCAVEVLAPGQLGSCYQSLFRPARPLGPFAEELTGLSNKQLAMEATFEDVSHLVMHFIQNAILISTHADFERAFLNKALMSVGKRGLSRSRFLDLRMKIPEAVRSEGASGIYNFTGIFPTNDDRPSEDVARIHWALLGV